MFLNIYIFFHLQFLSFNLITRTSPAADVKRKKKTDNATLKLNSGERGGKGKAGEGERREQFLNYAESFKLQQNKSIHFLVLLDQFHQLQFTIIPITI